MDEMDITTNTVETLEDEPVSEPKQDTADEKLRFELMRLSIPVLTSWLENMGYKASESIGKAELVDGIIKATARQVKASEALVREATEASLTDEDPVVDMVFENLESPGASIEFAWQPPDGCLKRNKNGKIVPKPVWHFFPGRTYKVPLSVVNHLNSLQVPADRQVTAGPDDFIQSVYTEEKKNRFSCRLKLTDHQVKAIAMKGT